MAIRTLKTSRDFVRIWFYWKKQAIFIFCLIVISICFYSFTQTPRYEATTKLMVLPKSAGELVVSPGNDSRQYLSSPVSNQDINTEIELIRSDVVINLTAQFYSQTDVNTAELFLDKKKGWLNSLIPSEKPLTDDVKRTKSILSSLDVESSISSNILSVYLKSPFQEKVADLLNKHIEFYLMHRKKTLSLGDTEAFYEEQKEYYAMQLEDAIKKKKKFNSQWNIVNMETQTTANLQLISTFQTELKNLEIALGENEAKMKMLEDGLQIQGDNFIISKEMRGMPIISELARGLVPLLIKRTEISKTFTKQSREYQQIDDQIKMLRQEIKNEGLNAAKTDRIEIKTLKVRIELLKNKITNLKKQSKEFQLKTEEHKALELDVELARNNFLLYGEKKENSRLFAKRNDSNLSNVVVLEAASTPLRQKSPNKLLALEVSIFLGLFAALILPFLLETLDHKLKTTDDIENILSLPVVCSYSEVK
ncbi:GumC family protein [Desulfobacula toluolica]|uniref:Lipopolysaccharide biosynthesis protein n=1 Tax=Desulfobacula toluolica (strain DSM 7467 / Tol2) TaxID=651182 RepID=K0NJX7_DESTT|nr:LPS biosynthesis protein [Desulfobacula toluolica]CCK81806.1 lipopolysaccharide biosynthesis protein [Desulfobacula toluolica Tol2]